MFIFLHNYHITPKRALKRAGYTERAHDKDFILADGASGRFHAKILDWKTIHIHYDIFVEERHWAPHLPSKLSQERRRITGYCKYMKFRDLKDREFKHLLNKYSVYN